MIVVDEKLELALAEPYLALVRALTQQHASRQQFYAFGSRVIGHAASRLRVKPHSELDLAIVDEPLPLEQLFAFRDAFSQSDLPMRVDIVQAGDLPERWRIRAWPSWHSVKQLLSEIRGRPSAWPLWRRALPYAFN